jgi:hypothetical protein
MLAEGLSRLTALKSNLPKNLYVSELFVSEFHVALDTLAKSSGADLSRFRIPDNAVSRVIESKNTLTGMNNWSRDKKCDRNLLMVRIDTVLGFFQLRGSRSEIGFVPPSLD